MKTKIVNGTTVISTGMTGGQKNKTGVTGVTRYDYPERYRVQMVVNKRKYSLGFYPTLELAKESKETADAHVKDGTFEEWFKTLPKYQYQKLSKDEKNKIYD